MKLSPLALFGWLCLLCFLIGLAYGIYFLVVFLKASKESFNCDAKKEEPFCGGACAMAKGL